MIRKVFAALSLAGLAACSPNFSNANLVPQNIEQKGSFPYALGIVKIKIADSEHQAGDINFGDDAVPVMESSLSEAIKKSGLFLPDAQEKAILSAEVLSLSYGAAGDQILPTRASSVMDVSYDLKRGNGAQVAHFQIHSFCAKGIGDEFVGIQRRNIAIECAVRKNILNAVTKLQTLIPSTPSPATISPSSN